jgi:hypothetical protein
MEYKHVHNWRSYRSYIQTDHTNNTYIQIMHTYTHSSRRGRYPQLDNINGIHTFKRTYTGFLYCLDVGGGHGHRMPDRRRHSFSLWGSHHLHGEPLWSMSRLWMHPCACAIVCVCVCVCMYVCVLFMHESMCLNWYA